MIRPNTDQGKGESEKLSLFFMPGMGVSHRVLVSVFLKSPAFGFFKSLCFGFS